MSKKRVTQNNGVKLTVEKGISALETANRLAEIAETADDKTVRKQALQALYLLKQAGVVPAPRAAAVVATPVETPERHRAFASAFDGAGNRLLLFVLAEPDGGSPVLLEILINDEQGVRDFDSLRMSKKDLDTRLKLIVDQLDDGLAVAEIPMEYGRWLIAQARAINQRLSRTTPLGFIDVVGKIGEPRTIFDRTPIYDRLPADQADTGEKLRYEPGEFFQLPWFGPWFFAAEEVKPWLDLLIGEGADATGLEEGQHNPWITQRLDEILDALMPDPVRQNYIHRLEESADILERRGLEEPARLTLAMARDLCDAGALHESEFARELTYRSFAATAAMTGAPTA